MQLKDLCDVFTDGDWIETKDQSSDGVRLVQTGNVKVGCFEDRGDKARYITEETFKRLNCTEVKKGDILVSRLPEPVGRACIVPNLAEKLITAVDCTIVRTTTNALPEYLNYYMQSPQYFSSVKDKVTGATRQRISRKNLGEINIFLPPLAEQQRIVAKLDAAFAEIDRAIELAEVKNAEVEKLKANVLKNLLSGGDCQTVKLGEVIEKTETVNPSSKFPNDSFEYIDVSSVNKKRLAIEETQTLLGKDAPSRARRRVHEYDVIFATVRPTLKRIAVVPNVLDGQICSTGYIVLRGKKDVLLPRYLFYWMTSQFVMEYVESVQTGASYPAVTDKQVKEIDIPLPPLAEQQRIVAKLDAAYAEIDIAKKSVVTVKTNYAALKSAILAQELQPSEAA